MISRVLIPLLVSASGFSLAQPIGPIAPEDRVDQAQRERSSEPNPDQAAAVRERMNAPFLTDEERAQLRFLHGQWTPQDLENPITNANAALIAHAYNQIDLDDNTLPALLRARAALETGNPSLALQIASTKDAEPEDRIESIAIRAGALERLGRTQDAIDLLDSVNTLLAPGSPETASAHALAHAALLLADLTRLRGPIGPVAAQYQTINTLIARARDTIDPLDWRVRLAEAQLLYAHHNLGAAHEAALEALRLNPRAAAPALLLGRIAVDGFDLDRADQIAQRLDTLSTTLGARDLDSDEPDASVGGAVLRARSALRRRDPQGAELAIDPALAIYPDQPQLLALQAAASASAYRMSSTQRLLDAYDERFPSSPDAYALVGSTLSEARQYTQAAEVLRRAIERAPHWGEPRLQLGLVLVQAGLDNEALRELEDAIELDPFNLRANNSRKLLLELATYDDIETDHFIIRYKPGIDEALAREMPDVLESIHDRVVGQLPGGVDYEPTQRTVIEIMPTHEWFAVRIGGMPSIHTMAASTGPIIAIESPRAGPNMRTGPYDWARVLQHEYTHTVNLAATNNRVIHWMTEANAVVNEDAPRGDDQWALLATAFRNNDLFDLESINTAFVRPEKPSDRSLAYAQGAWMFEYIIETYGHQAPRDIMDASSRGRDAPTALNETVGITQDDFMTAFLDWAKRDLQAIGLVTPDDVPSLNELLGDPRNGPPTPEALDDALAAHPDHPELLALKAGLTLARARDRLSDDQLTLMKDLAQARPQDELPHRRLARHFLSAEPFAERIESIEHLEFLAQREIHNPAFADQLATLHAQLEDHTRAHDWATRAARIAPFDAAVREQAARMALLASDMPSAMLHLEALVHIEPDRTIHTDRLHALQSMIEQRADP